MKFKEIKIFNAETLEYSGAIIMGCDSWAYKDISDTYMKEITSGMPLKAVLANLIFFGYVYDIIEN